VHTLGLKQNKNTYDAKFFGFHKWEYALAFASKQCTWPTFYFKVLFSFQRTRSTNAFSPPSPWLFPSHLLLFPPDGSKVRDMIYKLDNMEA
jgi:hypothetical protein